MIDDTYLVHSRYSPEVQSFRLALSQHQVWQFLDKPDPLVLELFLIEYCALGVAMTEPVEGWIRRAGERCQELGFAKVGAFFVSHAEQEKDHHQLFVNDTRWLVNRWNEKHDWHLDSDELLSQPFTPGIANYRDLHESTIAGNHPYCQVAIEFEIERLSISYGAAAIPKIVSVLGPQTINGLQFLEAHVRHDIGHTSRNEAQLNHVLRDIPAALPVLTETAGMALKAYGEYLSDCFGLALYEAALTKPEGACGSR